MTTETTNQTLQDLEQIILQSIPLSNSLGFKLRNLTQDSIIVDAPLEPNLNIHGTAFAGSIYSIGVLTAWGLTTHIISQAGIVADLVIAKASIRYRKPVIDSIQCACSISQSQRKRFLTSLQNANHGNLNLKVEVGNDSQASLDAIMIARKSIA